MLNDTGEEMVRENSGKTLPRDDFLALVGDRVREVRTARRLSRKQVAIESGVSQRYIAQLESGNGNISIILLRRIAEALDTKIEWLVSEAGPPPPNLASLMAGIQKASSDKLERIAAILRTGPESNQRFGRIALIGLRGAGKSTLGRLLADKLGYPFRETNEQIETITGISVNEIIAMYGQEGYRDLERQALERIAETKSPVIMAAAGGIVSEPASFEFLMQNFHSVWLKALPEEHMNRVREQGDTRPMAGNPAAMDDLISILKKRESHYQRAEIVIDTSNKSVETTLKLLLDSLSCTGIANPGA